MGQVVPRQHPAVVLRSHYRQLRALLAIALIMVVGASVALVIVANDDESISTSTTAKPSQPIEYGNFNPQTGRPMANGATPDESKIAAAISPAPQAAEQSGAGGVDESRVASAIGTSTASPTDEPSVSQAHPGARP